MATRRQQGRVGLPQARKSVSRLALFEDDAAVASPLRDDAHRIDARAQRKGVDERFAELGFDDDKCEAKDSDSDDLLDLMDSIK